MPTILLVRHAQASFGSDDYDVLSDLGHQQAAVLGEALATRGLDVHSLRSGSLRRQRETATTLSDRLGRHEQTPAGDPDLQIGTDDRWNEYAMDDILAAHGETDARATGHTGRSTITSAAFQDVLDHALNGWMAAGQNTTATESWPAFQDRTAAALTDLAASLGSGQTGVAVTSGGVIATLCARLLDLTTPQLLHVNRVAVNTSITKIAAGRRGLSLISLNDHSHLERPGANLLTYR